jgi:recombination protein RecA
MQAAMPLSALRALFPSAIASAAPAADNALFTLGALRGKVAELSARGVQAGALTIALGLLHEAQLEGANVAWIAASGPSAAGSFFPPDAAAMGLDLAALPFIRAPDPRAAGRAASHLLRAGAFAAVVLDLRASSAGPRSPPPAPEWPAGPSCVARRPGSAGEVGGAASASPQLLPQALLARLVGLAQKSDAALLVLTDKAPDDESLGSIVGLHVAIRCTPVRSHPAGPPRHFQLALSAAKDKRRGPGWSERRIFAAPADLD